MANEEQFEASGESIRRRRKRARAKVQWSAAKATPEVGGANDRQGRSKTIPHNGCFPAFHLSLDKFRWWLAALFNLGASGPTHGTRSSLCAPPETSARLDCHDQRAIDWPGHVARS